MAKRSSEESSQNKGRASAKSVPSHRARPAKGDAAKPKPASAAESAPRRKPAAKPPARDGKADAAAKPVAKPVRAAKAEPPKAGGSASRPKPAAARLRATPRSTPPSPEATAFDGVFPSEQPAAQSPEPSAEQPTIASAPAARLFVPGPVTTAVRAAALTAATMATHFMAAMTLGTSMLGGAATPKVRPEPPASGKPGNDDRA